MRAPTRSLPTAAAAAVATFVAVLATMLAPSVAVGSVAQFWPNQSHPCWGCHTAVGPTTKKYPAPSAQLSASCRVGLEAIMSNLNGGRTATFHLRVPSGKVRVIKIRPDQAKRRVFEVKPGDTATIAVRSKRMKRISLTWKNNCQTAS